MCDPVISVGEFSSYSGNDGINSFSIADQTMTLHLAVKSANMIATRRLISSGCNLNAMDECGYVALHIAASEGLVDMIKCLLAAGADVPGGDKAQCALHIAATRGHCDIVRLLLAAGAIVGALDVYHSTPLHYAASVATIK